MEGNERFSIDERDEFGKVADGLAEFVAGFYGKDPSTITETEMNLLVVARAYLRLYQVVFKDG
jgi:hypothetical protein